MASFALPAQQSHITLETLCGATCDWDWTYWGGIEPNSSASAP
jgi:hypothetical protein